MIRQFFKKFEAATDVAAAIEKGREIYTPKPFAFEALGAYRFASFGGALGGLASMWLGNQFAAAAASDAWGIGGGVALFVGLLGMFALEAAKGAALAFAARAYFSRKAPALILAAVGVAGGAVFGSFSAATSGAEIQGKRLIEAAAAAQTAAADSAAAAARGAAFEEVERLKTAQNAHFEATSWRGKLSAKNQGIYNAYAEKIEAATAAAAAAAAAAHAETLQSGGRKIEGANKTAALIYAVSVCVEAMIICCFIFGAYYTYRAQVEAQSTGGGLLINPLKNAAANNENPAEKGPENGGGVGFKVGQKPAPKTEDLQAQIAALQGQIAALQGYGTPLATPLQGSAQNGPHGPTNGLASPLQGAGEHLQGSGEGLQGSAYYWSHYPQMCLQILAAYSGQETHTIGQIAAAANVSESTVYRAKSALLHSM